MRERLPDLSAPEKPKTIDQLKSWLEKQYRRLKTPTARWVSMAMLALTTQGCGTVGRALSFEPGGGFTVTPGLAPGIEANKEQKDRQTSMDARVLGTDESGEQVSPSQKAEQAPVWKRGRVMAQAGLEGRPLKPGDSLWWQKGEGVYDAHEFHKLLDERLKVGASPEERKQYEERQKRLGRMLSGQEAGYLHYGTLEPHRPTQRIAITQFEFDPNSDAGFVTEEEQHRRSLSSRVRPPKKSGMDIKTETQEQRDRRLPQTVRPPFSPSLDYVPATKGGLKTPKERAQEIAVARQKRLFNAYVRGVDMLLPNTNAESGIRVVPHAERCWTSGTLTQAGADEQGRPAVVEDVVNHQGKERVSLRFEEIATLVPSAQEKTDSPERKLLRDAFLMSNGQALIEDGKIIEDDHTKAILNRFEVPGLAAMDMQLQMMERVIPFVEDIRKLQDEVRHEQDSLPDLIESHEDADGIHRRWQAKVPAKQKGSIDTGLLPRGPKRETAMERLIKKQQEFEAWKKDLFSKDLYVWQKDATEVPARKLFTAQKIHPLEKELEALRLSEQNSEAAGSVLGKKSRIEGAKAEFEEEVAKRMQRRVRIKEIESELGSLYAQRNAIPESKKEKIGSNSLVENPEMTKAERERTEAMRNLFKKWEDLTKEREGMIRKMRDIHLRGTLINLAPLVPSPMRFHVTVNEKLGYVAVIAVIEKEQKEEAK